MQHKDWLKFVFFISLLQPLAAQQTATYTHPMQSYNKAVALYTAGQYSTAAQLFNTISTPDLQADCDYYVAICALKSNQNNGDELLQNFIKNHPTSIKQNQASLEAAHYYFELNNYPEALQWLEKVAESSLSFEDLETYTFQKGYCFFNAKNKKQATTHFNKVVNSKKYGAQAKYYLGFMAYEGDDYKQATKYFDEVSGEEKYKEKLSYYQADMNFKLGNFQKAIDLGGKAMTQSNALEHSELNKIIGESHFNLKNYAAAIPFLENYKGKKGKWNNTDFYQLGYAYYQQKEYEKAIMQFNKIIAGQDFVAQNAYYHLGESYLNLNQKQQALNAFKNASEMVFDTAIQEDAFLNYAKLGYEIGNAYQNSSEVLQNFIKKYPNNTNNPDLEIVLIDSYVSSKNYAAALVLLEKNKTVENKLVYQKVSFLNGIELYTNKNYVGAAALFEKSLETQKDPTYTARATFWEAETQYVLGYFKNASQGYTRFLDMEIAKTTPEIKQCNYNLGYAYFKQKEYELAILCFQNQTKNTATDKVHLGDAYLRLGDCQFATTKYTAAIESYQNAIRTKNKDADYAQYQKAICYGLSNKNEVKTEQLNLFLQEYPKSDYRDDALFELANTYITQNKTELALKTFDKLNLEFPGGILASKAILRQGLVYYNADKDDLALAKFKKIVAEYPKSAEALEAVATARLIYVDNGNITEYASWVRSLDFVVVTDAELDNDTFEGAEKQYFQNNSKLAIAGLSTYKTQFPNGNHALKAHYYLGEMYFATTEDAKAIENFDYVTRQGNNEFMEVSWNKLAQLYLKKEDKTNAIASLLQLEKIASNAQNRNFAQANLMQLYYQNQEYNLAVAYADKVLANPKTEASVQNDAQIILARSAIKTNDWNKARLAFAKLQATAKGEMAAECLYYEAYFKNSDGKLEESNKIIQKLAKNYASYNYYAAKGLVVMAKNFYGLKDSFQASYILESVIKNFSKYNDVLAEAQQELKNIKTEEAKTNSSIAN